MGPRKQLRRALATLDHDRGTAGEASSASPSSGEAERRQLTVMFCDLVGSTALSESMDLEDYRDLLTRYQTTVVAAVEQHDGYVARYMGDGLLAYFGFPSAREDDAVRAVRAGLSVAGSVSGLSGPIPIEVRVGIATGPVVVGDVLSAGSSSEIAALGATPNLAARLQAEAPPGAVLISRLTERLTGKRFELEPLRLEVKGFDAPVQAFAVRGPCDGASSVSRASASTAPLVGRQEELALLSSRWRRASEGEGQVVLLSGEPGIGKSRLAQEFAAGTGSAETGPLALAGSPYHTASPLYPVVAWLTLALTEEATGSGEDALHAWLSGRGLDPFSIGPPLASLLSSEGPDTSDEGTVRRRTFDALLRLLLPQDGVTRLLLVEDAHWLDPSTLELLGELMARIRNLPMMALLTHRPEFSAPWGDYPYQLSYRLSGLSRREVEALAELTAGDRELPPAVTRAVVDGADGFPLYAEELTKNLLESAAEAASGADSSQSRVPATLKDSLTARLDRLGAAKRLAQVASVIGRSFQLDLLTAVHGSAEATRDQVSALIDSGLILHDPGGGEGVYVFKHALVRDTAYESMLHSRCREVHAAVARCLEDRPEAAASPELLAYHLERAGEVRRAYVLWCSAGRRSAERAHYAEAIRCYEHALTILQTLHPSRERDESELELRTLMAAPLVAAHGFAGEPVEVNAERALELSEALDDAGKRVVAAYAYWVNHRVRGRSRELLPIVERFERQGTFGAGHHATLLRMRGQSLFDLGRTHESDEAFVAALALLRAQPSTRSFVHGTDPIVQCHFYLALCRWMTGRPETARTTMQLAIEEAERLEHANTLAVCLAHALMLDTLDRDFGRMAGGAARLQALSDDRGLPQFQAFARFYSALTLEDPSSSAEAILRASALVERTRNGLLTPNRLTWLAEKQSEFDCERALRTMRDARAVVERHGEAWFEPEMRRVEAGIRRRAGQTEEARDCLRSAIELARERGNICWLLRSLVDQVRTCAVEDDVEALESLSRCVSSLSEGGSLPEFEVALSVLAQRG